VFGFPLYLDIDFDVQLVSIKARQSSVETHSRLVEYLTSLISSIKARQSSVETHSRLVEYLTSLISSIKLETNPEQAAESLNVIEITTTCFDSSFLGKGRLPVQ